MPKSSRQLGLRIKELREQRGWTQRECGTYLNLHHTFIAAIESGRKNVTLATIDKIADGFGITLEELFKGL